jgi:dTDP-4-dehydrorhamnose 3,5-epimerase
MVEVRRLELDGVLEIVTPRFGDERGFFSETWNQKSFAAAGIDLQFVQDNHSYSASRGVIRGLHFQAPPLAQDKLVRVTRGAVYDVVVDLRSGSPSYGRWLGITISAEKWNQILVPKGFAHGFATLEPHTEVVYKVTAPYSREHDRAIRYDDPTIGIDWPIRADEAIVSSKDAAAPLLSAIETGF